MNTNSSEYFVYILTCNSRKVYVGVTNNLERRVAEHKSQQIEGFAKRYNLDQLVYYESTPNILSAIEREKLIKGWSRRKKEALITAMNPTWRDLAAAIGRDSSACLGIEDKQASE